MAAKKTKTIKRVGKVKTLKSIKTVKSVKTSRPPKKSTEKQTAYPVEKLVKSSVPRLPKKVALTILLAILAGAILLAMLLMKNRDTLKHSIQSYGLNEPEIEIEKLKSEVYSEPSIKDNKESIRYAVNFFKVSNIHDVDVQKMESLLN